jgi:phosphatidylinositol alpha 1,6-mannosyltransferase
MPFPAANVAAGTRTQQTDINQRLSSQMPTDLPRVAYFPDSFHEVNGVAHTSRHFEAFARRRNLPFLCIRAGDRAENGGEAFIQDGNVWTLELPRSILSFALEKDLRFDPAFPRHIPLIGEVLDRFRPGLIHITGPSEVGMLGAGLSYHRDLPLAASWHTNVHEYLARRSDWLLRLLPLRQSLSTGRKIQDLTLAAAARFYSIAKVLYAPNIELCELLESSTGRPCFLMPRGVDTELFSPCKRPAVAKGAPFVLGFVGRLSIEKNITLLAAIHAELLELGLTNFRFLIIGHGTEQSWLRERMPQAEFPGVLHGEALAQAYASMDLFVFPSHTDTFGNVVLEALASGVPAIVTPDGGPRYIVRDTQRDDATGRIVPDGEFTRAIAGILGDPAAHHAMRLAARSYALTASWDAVFEGVYSGYRGIVPVRRELAAAAS